ncbi:hypothetical protein PSI9734_01316 [Pseudidiomarina piscicola]|uniref:ATP synthase protein I n=1 Tax=Pseudidiomarina piscicola TaxID=2614830 RepID=A0A6S6WUL7_9GAMM|nr:ATP synthase subunit I [Pseudidiomarina piscicola]CAB0150877.1 hypothetical protein PSI9734_01316 [Pseudidiomarina piscicola]VZT40382.1 hypothetical protein PSI9734_01316 [Pseudomonas aeruginosa]
MTKTLTNAGKQLAVRLLRAQGTALFLVACSFSLATSYEYFWGVVGGGIVVMIPTALFAWRAFAQGGARSAQQIVGNFFAGQALKMSFTVILLVALLMFTSLPLVAVCSGYITVLIVQWVAPILFLKST